MNTALDCISDALQMLGVTDPGTAGSDADAERGLSALNDMLDSWSNESLTTFAIALQSFPLVAGQQTYTIGAGGQINVARPIRILGDPGACFVRDGNGNDFPVGVIGEDEWDQIPEPGDTSQYPEVLWYDPQFPLGNINLWPVPQAPAFTMFFSSYQALADLSSLTTPLSLPPGYKLAITTNLALALQPYFVDGPINPIIVERASKSLANIKRSNMRPIVAGFDGEIVSRGSSAYDVYTDGNRR